MPKHWYQTAVVVASGVATAAVSIYLASLYSAASQNVEESADRRKRGTHVAFWQDTTCMHTNQQADCSLVAVPTHSNGQQQLQHEQKVQDSREQQQQQAAAAASPDPPPTPAAQQHHRPPATAPTATPRDNLTGGTSTSNTAPAAAAVAATRKDTGAVTLQADFDATVADTASDQEAAEAAAAVELEAPTNIADLQIQQQHQQQPQQQPQPQQQQQENEEAGLLCQGQDVKQQQAQAADPQPAASSQDHHSRQASLPQLEAQRQNEPLHLSQQQQQPLPTPPPSPKGAQTSQNSLPGEVQEQQQQMQQHLAQEQQQLQEQQPQQNQQEPQQQMPSEHQLVWSGLQRQRSAVQRMSLDSGFGVAASVQHTADVPHKQHRSFNTARHAPSLDTTIASAAVTRSLGVQYKVSSTGGSAAAAAAAPAGPSEQQGSLRGAAAGGRHSLDTLLKCSDVEAACDQNKDEGVSSLAASCAALCVQHCDKLQAAGGRETTVLDIGCGTGGCCFELAASFSHVLGIDGDLLNITAAKELKAHGELCFRPLSAAATAAGAGAATGPAAAAAAAAAAAGVAAAAAAEGHQEEEGGEVFVVRVPDAIDRDRVRFWHCPLPQLPPKLAPVDAVLVEDVDGHLGPGLHSVCEQLPLLLNPEGVCVVVLGVAPEAAAEASGDIQRIGGAGAGAGAAQVAGVVAPLAAHGTGDVQSVGVAVDAAVGTIGARAGVNASVEGASRSGVGGAVSLEDVKAWLGAAGLRFVREERLKYGSSGSLVQAAHAGVWLQQ